LYKDFCFFWDKMELRTCSISAFVILTRGKYIHTLHLDECILGAMGVFSPQLLVIERYSDADLPLKPEHILFFFWLAMLISLGVGV